MSPEEIIDALEGYDRDLNSILSRFSKRGGGFHMDPSDAPRCRQIIQELVDLFDDTIGHNVYSASIAHFINEGISSFSGNPTSAAIEETQSVVRAAATRIKRNPAIIKGYSQEVPPAQRPIWDLMHSAVVQLARPRFEAGHYADAVEAALKEVNTRVKLAFKAATSQELDGVPLMRKAFKEDAPVIVLDDLQTETGRNIQRGHLDLFAGAMAGIRNPKAHENIVITPERALHHLMLASLLFHKLDERLEA